MVTIGTAYTKSAKKVLLLGSGELGKELAISLIRLGAEVIAVDSYPNAPAMQVANRAHVCNMLDSNELKKIIYQEKPNLIVPEVEAIAIDCLRELEKEGFQVVPNANATYITMHRERIRKLAAEELQLPTSRYYFAATLSECQMQIEKVGYPCVMKPVMSSSGKGQKVIKNYDDIEKAFEYAQSNGRAGEGRVIVEEWLDFDEEITLLTLRHKTGTSFCAPIGHFQKDGDYQYSWQPHPLSNHVLAKAETMAKQITDSLGGYGIFGVELFIKGDEVIFSEVSPRPHDTGMVTLISQQLSEFDCHARAILELPIPKIRAYGPAASHVIIASGKSENISYGNIDKALSSSDTDIRLFGKPSVNGSRRVGVALALSDSVADAKAKASKVAKTVKLILE